MSLEPIMVLPVGTYVTIGEEVKAHVKSIQIMEHGILYECCWWNGNEYKKEWLSPFEITCTTEISQKIGFK